MFVITHYEMTPGAHFTKDFPLRFEKADWEKCQNIENFFKSAFN